MRLAARTALFVAAVTMHTLPATGMAAASPLASGGVDGAALDSFVAAQMAKHGIRGVSLAVVQGDQIVHLQGYGTAGHGSPMTPQTPMYIGSQSKSFTGLVVAQLAEHGRLDLAAPVRTYLPGFRVADPEASGAITVQHVLHHISGLSESGFTPHLAEDATAEDAVRALASARLTALVGTTFQYFNHGYIVLAQIIEAVTGQTYERVHQDSVLDPLGMANTFTDPAAARAHGLSQGYSRFFGFPVPRRQPHRRYEISEGFIMSTAEDMAHFAIAVNNGGAYRSVRLLGPAGSADLFSPVEGYGMGWFVQHVGWGLLAFVLALSAFQARNLRSLRGWTVRSREWSAARRARDVAVSFLIPTVILVVVFSQLRHFFGDRINWTTQVVQMWRVLPDVGMLMIVGSVPDYAQGLIKLSWLMRGKADADESLGRPRSAGRH